MRPLGGFVFRRSPSARRRARRRPQQKIQRQRLRLGKKKRTMSKIAVIAFVTISLVAGAASTPAFAVSSRAVAQGEKETRQLLRLMDVDQNGRVSKQEFMQFMEAEFDRLDVDRSGELTVKELSHFRYSPPHPGGTRR